MAHNPLLDDKPFANENPLHSTPSSRYSPPPTDPNDEAPVWMKVICFLFPIIGIIIWLATNKATSPKKAQEALTFSLYGIGAFVLMQFLC